jgi:hypothetical protein
VKTPCWHVFDPADIDRGPFIVVLSPILSNFVEFTVVGRYEWITFGSSFYPF